MVDLNYIEKVKKEYDKASEWAKSKGYTSDELRKKQSRNDAVLAERRGYILNRMAEIEHLLNMFLAKYFTPPFDSELWSKFYDLVLGEDFTLNQKIKLFGKLDYHEGEEFNHVFDGLTDILHELKGMRNIVAHGFKAHGTKPEITYLGSHKFKTLDDNFMNEFNKNFEIAFICLDKLNDSLMKKKLKKYGHHGSL